MGISGFVKGRYGAGHRHIPECGVSGPAGKLCPEGNECQAEYRAGQTRWNVPVSEQCQVRSRAGIQV